MLLNKRVTGLTLKIFSRHELNIISVLVISVQVLPLEDLILEVTNISWTQSGPWQSGHLAPPLFFLQI